MKLRWRFWRALERADGGALRRTADVKPSLRYSLLASIWAAVLAVAILALSARGPELAGVLSAALAGIRLELILGAFGWLKALALLLTAVWLVEVWLRRQFGRYVVADGRLTAIRGPLGGERTVLALARIRKLTLIRPPAGRLLDYGHVIVDDGTHSPPVLDHVPRPAEFLAALQAGMERAGR